MAQAKKETTNVAEIWTLYQEAQTKADKLKEPFDRAQADADLLKAKLIWTIPANQAVDGVLHKQFKRSNVSYAKALTAVVAKLVPKTKANEVTVIMDEFTSTTLIDKVELEK